MPTDALADDWKQDLAETLAAIGRTHMPFGKFGPDAFPPKGMPIYDLPYEYLRWFERKGYPRGALGQLMKVVHDLKLDGADAVFEPLRAHAGGRRSLRHPRPTGNRLG